MKLYEFEKCFKGHTNLISDLAISKNNDFIVSISFDRTIRCWNIINNKNYKEKNSLDKSFSFSETEFD